MKAIVINLPRRKDRLDYFKDINAATLTKLELEVLEAVDGRELDMRTVIRMGFDTSKSWRDPIRKTKLTRGEVGCFISHFKAWERCVELDEPVLILEDDAIFTDRFDPAEVERLSEAYDVLYLARREMDAAHVINIDDDLEKPSYPYWCCAYVVTPRAAYTLVNGGGRSEIVPADEYVPLMLDRLSAAAYKENVVLTRGKEDGQTDIDPRSEEDYFIDFPVHIVSVGSDRAKCEKLLKSAEYYGIEVTLLGEGAEWRGTDMSGPGGGQKINLFREYLKELPDHHVVLFVDGYDVFFCGSLDTIARRYFGFGNRLLFAAETELWPDKNLLHPRSHTPYRFLNSGLFIGEVGTLKAVLSEPIEDWGDDQLYYQRRFLSGNFDIGLDRECYLFQCDSDGLEQRGDLLYNPLTGCCPRLYHGNGGAEAKARLERYYKWFDFSPSRWIRTSDYTVLDRDMILIDFMTESQCEDMIRLADSHGGWGSMYGDKFPAQEIRIRELGLWEAMEDHWRKVVFPICERYWHPLEMYGLRDAFVMRYALDTQTSLALHHDASLVTGSVKLNDDYLGAELYFPRQKVTNIDIPVGKCILFPGQVTHGHTCTELTHGVKYSLTMWTSRLRGDVN